MDFSKSTGASMHSDFNESQTQYTPTPVNYEHKLPLDDFVKAFIALRDLGKRLDDSPRGFRCCDVKEESTFKYREAKTSDVSPVMFRYFKARFERYGLYDALNDENSPAVLRDMYGYLPKVMDLYPEMKVPKFCFVSRQADIERCIILPRRYLIDENILSDIKTMSYNENTRRFMVFNKVPEYFEAQSLFGVDLNIGLDEETREFLTNACGLNQSSPAWTRGAKLVCKAYILVNHWTNPGTIIATLVDILLDWGSPLNLVSSAVSMIATYVTNIDTMRAQVACNIGLMNLGASILSVLFCILGSAALPSQKIIDTILRRTSDLGRATSGITTLLEVFKTLFNKVFSWCYELMYGIPYIGEEMDLFLADIRVWYEKVHEISTIQHNDALVDDFKLCRKVEELYTIGMDYSQRIAQFKLPPAQKQAFDSVFRIVTKLYDQVIANGARNHGPRTEPLVIHLFGPSSVGKSGLTYLLGQDLLQIEGLENEVLNELYFRNVEQEYWDAYHGQAICVYDDFGQMRDSQGNPNKEFMEIIRSGNIAPWPLHMASLAEKAKTRFKSRCVLLTSNQNVFAMDSITCETAFKRRKDLYAKVTVNSCYADANGRIDKSKTNGVPLESDVYTFTLYGEDDQPYMRTVTRPGYSYTEEYTLSYKEFSALARKMYTDKFKASTDKMNFLLNRGKNMPSMDDVEPIDINSLKEEHADRINSYYEEKSELNELKNRASKYRAQVDDEIALLEAPAEPVTIELWRAISVYTWSRWSGIRKEMIGAIASEVYEPFLKRLEQKETYSDYQMYVFDILAMHFGGTIPKVEIQNKAIFEVLESFCCSIYHKKPGKVKFALSYVGSSFVIFSEYLLQYTFPEAQRVVVENYKLFGKICLFAITTALAYKAVTKVLSKDLKTMKWDDFGRFDEDDEYDVDGNLVSHRILGPVSAEPKHQVIAESVDVERKPRIEKKQFAETEELERKPRNKKKQFAETEEFERKPRKGKKKFVTEDNASVTSFESCKSKVNYVSEGCIDPNSRELVNTTIKSNTYVVCTRKEDQWRPCVNCLFIKGRIAIIVSHARGHLGHYIKLKNGKCQEGFIVPVSDIQFVDCEGLDISFMIFPRQVAQHPNLVKHFMTQEDLSKFGKIRGNLFSVWQENAGKEQVIEYRQYTLPNIVAIDTAAYYHTKVNGEEEELFVRKGYRYECETRPGDCTSPIIASCPAIARKIIGIHVAGASSGRALGQSITQEKLISYLDKLDNYEAQLAYDPDDLNVDTEVEPDLPKGDFIPIGKVEKAPGTSSKTQLRESIIYGLVKEPSTKPAALHRVKVNGEIVDPLRKGLEKCGNQNPLVDEKLLSRCATHVLRKLQTMGDYNQKKVLTLAEAIQGVENDPWLHAVNRKTSPGYPWCLNRGATTGKRKWLGNDDNFILDHPDVVRECTKRIEFAKKGKRYPTLWIDTLKDERRPIAKVDQGKTRVFSAGSMDYILNMRQYFLSFIGACMDKRIYNEIALGINPYSSDWTELALHLQKKGPDVCAGDFSNFDGSLLSVFLWKICDIINDWYDDGQENKNIRLALFSEIVNSVHLCGNNVYSWTHSQPSGNPMTTVINCMMNMLIFRYIFCDITNLTLADFDRNISFISYGDDNVINISKRILPIFNQHTISEGCAKIGFTYTDESKTGVLVTSKNLKDINFLKRGFRIDDFGNYSAPLELDTVLEMCMWVRGDIDPEKLCSDNVENAYRELSLHGKGIFTEWSEKINAICCANMVEPPMLYDYDTYISMKVDYFTPSI